MSPAPPSRARPPRWARALLAGAVWRADRPWVLADLDEEFEQIVASAGARTARKWYARQVRGSLLPVATLRLGRSIRSLGRASGIAPADGSSGVASPDGSGVARADASAPTPPGGRPRADGQIDIEPPPPRSEDRMSLLQRWVQDAVHATRAVRRSRRYAVAVIATFALASGANIAVFSVVQSVLLEPLPYPAPEELVMVHRVSDHGDESGVSLLDFEDWREAAASFASWAGYTGAARTFLGASGAERWRGVETTSELFEALGVPARLGRTLLPSDRIDDPVIVLGHRLWAGTFASDPDILGKTVRFEGRSLTVVGVMPPDFYFPTPDEHYWMPLESAPFLEQRGAWFLRTIGRLGPGVTAGAAQAEIGAVARRVAEEVEGTTEGTAIRVESRHEAYVGDTRTLFGILLGAVGLVLAIACANIANLGMTRATTRGRELAVRAALGAGRGRLGRQLVTEHVLLAFAGALGGLALSLVVVRGLVALGPDDLPRLAEIGVDFTALGYAIAIALVCGVLFGAAPAVSASRIGISSGLKTAERGALGRGGKRTLGALVTAQISLAVVLLLGAGLLVNSFLRLSAVRPGFDVDHTLSVQIALPQARYGTPEEVEAFYVAATTRLTAHPGIEAVGFTTHLPFSGSDIQASYRVESPGSEPVGGSGLQLEVVGAGYFESVGIPLLAGRDVATYDRADAPLVALINERFAELGWPGGNPIGQRFTLDDSEAEPPWHEVIGVVGTTLKQGLDDNERPVAYFPRPQFAPTYSIMSGRSGYLTLRTAAGPASVVPAVRAELAAIDPALPLPRIETARQLVSASIAEPRFRTILLGSFAGLALLVALVGVYGVIAFAVTRRTREIGIRMALGATAPRILRQVLGGGSALLGLGLIVGVGGGLAASRVLESMLFGVSPADPVTFLAAVVFVCVAGLAACYLPARRASRVEPVIALREE